MLDSHLVYFLDLRDPERLEIPVLSTKGHDLIINAIDGYGPTFADTKTTELLTGGRDGRIAFNGISVAELAFLFT
jgi:hypothetical protein